MKRLGAALAAVITLAAAWLVLEQTGLGNWLARRWNGLDNTQGFVIGAVVALLGVLVNNLALARIERARHDRAMEADALRHQRAIEVADTEWQRETSKVMNATRREVHGNLIAQTQDAWNVVRISDHEERTQRRRELSSTIGGTLARIRLLSDDEDTIQAAREFGARAILLARNPALAERKAFDDARNKFVRLARAELGRAELPDLPPIEEIVTLEGPGAATEGVTP